MMDDGNINDFGGGSGGSQGNEVYNVFKQYLLTYFTECTNQEGSAGEMFLIEEKWYAPKYGCDTIQNMLEDLKDRLNELK